MTDEQINAAVAKEVFGLPVVYGPKPYRMHNDTDTTEHPYLKGVVDGVTYDWAAVPNYSTSIADAWRVGVKMQQLGYFPAIRLDAEGERWVCTMTSEYGKVSMAVDASAPRAICLAALAAKGAKTK